MSLAKKSRQIRKKSVEEAGFFRRIRFLSEKCGNVHKFVLCYPQTIKEKEP